MIASIDLEGCDVELVEVDAPQINYRGHRSESARRCG
jgi:hypothetical protein